MKDEMSEKEAEEFVVQLLRENDNLTTRQIETEAAKRNRTCPDAIIRFLNKLKLKGIIKGKLSVEHRGWIWFIEKNGPGNP